MRRFVVLLWLLLLIACDGSTADAPTDVPPVSNIPTAAPTAISAELPPTPQSSSTNTPRFELRVWLSQEVARSTDPDASTLLSIQLTDFDTTHPDIELLVDEKTTSDQGGSLSYLRTGRNVAPSALPDVIVLPAGELANAVDEGLIFPLDDLVATDGLYLAAVELGSVNGALYGLPFALTGLHHFAYNRVVLSSDFPTRWDDLVASDRHRLMLAAAGDDASALAFQLYNDENGSLASGSERFNFESNALAAGLDQIRLANDSGIIADESSRTTTPQDSWSLFQRGEANIVMVTPEQYLQRRSEGTSSAFVAIPGREGAMEPLVSGWMWAIATPDPARQAISAELIQWLNNPSNLGTWSAAAGLLPSRPIAFGSWQNDAYTTFLQRQLQEARAVPNRFDAVGNNALINAVVSIINLSVDTATAAGQVIDTINQ